MVVAEKFNQYDKILVILVASLAFGGLGGLFQVSRLLSVALIPLMLAEFQKSESFVKPYFVFIILFFVYASLSVAWVPAENETMRRFTYAVFHFLIFLEILVFSYQAKNPTKALAYGWLIAVCFTLLVAMWEIVTDNHLSISKQKSDLATMNKGVVTYRNFASVTFYNYNTYVTFLCFAFPFLTHILLREEKHKPLAVTIIAMALSALVVTVNASRGGILSISLMTVFYFLFAPKNKKTISAMIIVVLAIAYFAVKYGEFIFLAIQVRLVETGMVEDDSRIDIWRKSIEAFWNSYGFGVGMGGIEEGLRSVKCGVLATHNLVIEALLELGVFGFVSIAIFLFKLVARSLKNREKVIRRSLIIAFLGAPIYFIIDSLYLADTFAFVYFASLIVFSYSSVTGPIHKKRRLVTA